MTPKLQKIRHLVLPSRPDPARSRQIAEGRLLVCCLFAFGIFITIGVKIVGLADSRASAHLALKGGNVTEERGHILDRNGRLLAGNLPITVLHADPSEIMNSIEAASKLAPFLAKHDQKSGRRGLGRYCFQKFSRTIGLEIANGRGCALSAIHAKI